MKEIHIILMVKFFVVNFSIVASNEMVTTKNAYQKWNEKVSYCEKLEGELKPKEKRYFYVDGKESNVTIMWGARTPNRVAGSLLMTALRHQLGYQRISLVPGPRTLFELAERTNADELNYGEIFIHMGVETGIDHSNFSTGSADVNFLTISRLTSFGPPVAPITLQLHALLTTEARTSPACADANVWTWYRNSTATTACGFDAEVPLELYFRNKNISFADLFSNNQSIPVLVPYDLKKSTTHEIPQLIENINKTFLPWRIIPISDESDLRKFIEEYYSSILFVDYDIWGDNTNVIKVQPPLSDFKVEALRVGDAKMIREKAPPIYSVLHRQCIQSKAIHEILKLEGSGLSVEEAACAYTLNDIEQFKSWANTNDDIYKIVILLCENYHIHINSKYAKSVLTYLRKTYRNIKIKLFKMFINCTDPDDLTKVLLNDLQKNIEFIGVIGILAAGEGAVAASTHALSTHTLLVLYDVPSIQTQLSEAVRTAVGTVQSLAKALIHFIKSNGWRRIAVLSDNSQIASDFVNLLIDELVITNRRLSQNSAFVMEKVLNELRELNGRIFFINMRFSTARLVICKALELGLTSAAGYAWIVRDWEEGVTCNYIEDMEHFTLTYSWQGIEKEELVQEDNINFLRRNISKLWNNSVPTIIAPVTDALILLTHTVALGLRSYPQLRHDLQGNGALKLISKAFMNSSPAIGISQELKQSKFALDAPLVFVNVWKGMKRKPLAIWRINDSQVEELKMYEKAYANSTPPHDGTQSCLYKKGDPFFPSCYDVYWAILGIFLLSIPVAVWAGMKLWKDAMAANYKSLSLKLLARCDQVAVALEDHLVDRSALDLQEKLGSGNFGRVCSGTLTLSNKPPVSVAVKALKENASRTEEAEFLREACALAMLTHENIIGFIGVCADSGGPPLLLMNNAFFGDLQRYLYKRRSLVHLDGVDEAKAVSPRELTRLAREASEALSYLAEKRFVHRDVRAANCLVDENRTLKLADFGLARAIDPGSSDSLSVDDKYLSKRRGMFAVAWMAPETVLDGVFSYASDVWSLGVLMLEIVSLGDKPYGTWKPPIILKFVYQGGHPPLPTDVNYHTSELLLQFWSLLPAARPSAKTIAARLCLQPTILHPALRPANLRDSRLITAADEQLRISTL